jgi:hypothetical protein
MNIWIVTKIILPKIETKFLQVSLTGHIKVRFQFSKTGEQKKDDSNLEE